MDVVGAAGVGATRYSVIVADDHEDDRFLLRRALEHDGRFVVVAEAQDGSEAVRLAELHQPDLAVVDLAMPDLDGLETTNALRTASPATTVVVLSNFGSGRMSAPAQTAGAAAYLEKSTPPAELVDALIQALRHPVPAPGPADPELARSILTADGLAPTAARKFVLRVLGEWQLAGRADEVLLLVSELVTNAVVHARSDLEVTLQRTGARLRVEVHDRDPRRVEPLAWTEDQERGRGVALVEALSDAWGVDDADVGKVIWFEMGL